MGGTTSLVGGCAAPREPNAWEIWFFRLHRAFAVFGVAIAVGILGFGDGSLSWRLAQVGLAALLGLWCWWMLTRQAPFTFDTWQGGVGFLAVALPLFATLGAMHPIWQSLYFLAYWQVFSILPVVPGLVTSCVLSIGIMWAVQGPRLGFPDIGVAGWAFIAISMCVSLAMALFIRAIIIQSGSRQALVEELEATRESLARSERAAGVADERRRLAGELHDTLAQDFTSIVMHLEAAEARFEAGASPLEHISMARDSARSGLRDSRRIVHALLPDLLEGADIDRAITTLVARWSRETGIPAAAAIDGEPVPLDRHTEVVLFRALQETLANITKHAGASTVNVTLSYLDDVAVLDVHDDGRGFDADHISAGVGLEVMRQRLAETGGTMEIESLPGDGTTIAITVATKAEGETPA